MTDFQRNSASAVPGIQPLAYLNPNQPSNVLKVTAHRDPTTSDRKYKLGTIWINIDTNDVWCLTSVVSNVSNWEPIGQDTAGAAPLSKYVVDADGSADFLTIQEALDAASVTGANSTIYVRPGTYTENLTLYGNTQVVGATGFSDAGTGIEIIGVHTPPIGAGFVFRNIKLTSATHIFSSTSAGTATLILGDCLIQTTSGYTFNLPNWVGAFRGFNLRASGAGDNAVINNTAGATVFITDSTLGNPLGASILLSGNSTFFNVHIQNQVSIQGNGSTNINGGSWLSKNLTISGNSSVNISNSLLRTGATVPITHNSTGTLSISSCNIDSSALNVITGTGAGTTTLNGVHFQDSSGLVATLTVIFPSETMEGKLLVGDATYKPNTFTPEEGLIQAYGNDTSSGATSRKAIIADLDAQDGDGNSIPQAMNSQISVSSGANISAAYGSYNYALQKDGSQIVSNLVGSLGYAYVQETDAGDQPQAYLCGVNAVLSADDTAAAPTLNNQAASIGILTYDAPFDTIGCGFIATRSGTNTGTAAKAAFKVVQGTKAADDWQYGLDLYNESGTQDYAVADIRFWDQATLNSDPGASRFTCAATKGFEIVLGEAAGASFLKIINTTPATVASIDSSGNISSASLAATQAVDGGQLQASSDIGGVATKTCFTNVFSGVNVGAGSVLMNSVNPANSSGWIKIYVNGNPRYIPYWDTNTP